MLRQGRFNNMPLKVVFIEQGLKEAIEQCQLHCEVDQLLLSNFKLDPFSDGRPSQTLELNLLIFSNYGMSVTLSAVQSKDSVSFFLGASKTKVNLQTKLFCRSYSPCATCTIAKSESTAIATPIFQILLFLRIIRTV